jgi:hypothetical protein
MADNVINAEHYLLDGYRQALALWQSKQTPLSSAMYCFAFVTGWEQEVGELREWDEVPADMVPGYMAIMSRQNGEDTRLRAQDEAYHDGRVAGYASKRVSA